MALAPRTVQNIPDHASCVLSPAQWSTRSLPGTGYCHMGRSREHRYTSLRQSWTVSPSIGLAVEPSQVPLPLPAAVAPRGIAQITFRQETFANCAGSHPHHIPHWPGRIRPNRFGPLGLVDDCCVCSHHTHSCCTKSAKISFQQPAVAGPFL